MIFDASKNNAVDLNGIKALVAASHESLLHPLKYINPGEIYIVKRL